MNNDLMERVIRTDERTKTTAEDVKHIKEKLENLNCSGYSERIKTLERESKENKKKKLDTRLWAIEKLFWPSIITGITSFMGFLFFVLRGHI